MSVSTLCQSQTKAYNFEHYYARDGYPLSYILDIKEDKLGFIWMASSEGLIRFDGVNFKKFYHDPDDPTSIDNNPVTNILPHSDGRIYLCTDRYGLSIYDPITNIFSKPGFKQDSIEVEQPKHSSYMFEDYRSLIWIIDKKGIFVYDPVIDSLWTPECFSPTNFGLNAEDKLAFFECKSDINDPNIIWIASLYGLFEYNIKNDSVSLWTHKVKDEDFSANMSIHQIHQTESDTIFLATEASGIIAFNKRTKEYGDQNVDWLKVGIWASNFIDENTIWLGETDRFSSFDTRSKKYTKVEINDASHYNSSYGDIRSIYIDSQNTIWLGRNSGVTKYSKSSNRFNTHKLDESKDLSFVKTAFYDKSNNQTYAASKAGVLVFNDNNFNQISKVIHAPGTLFFPRNVRKYKEYYYTLSMNRVWRFKVDSDSLKLFQKIGTSTTNGFEIDSKGNIWIFPWSKDLVRLNINTKESETIEFSDHKQEHIYKQMIIDSADNIYYGVADGLIKLSPKEDTFTHKLYTQSLNGIELNEVTGVTFDLDGNIKFASDENGIFSYSKSSGDISRISEFSNANNIGVDESGYIWATSDNGLHRINQKTGDYNSFNILDGLAQQNFEMVCMSTIKNNEIFIGYNSSYSIIQNDKNYTNDEPYNSTITTLEVNGKQWSGEGDILYKDKIELSNEQNYLRFGFCSMNFDQVGKNRFRYKLEGYDKDWSIETSENLATYTRIPPGNYSFKVINANNDGIWNMEPDILDVYIKPAWYQAGWFRLGVIFLLAYLSWFFYKRRSLQIAKEAKLKSEFELKISELEMKSLKAQMNPHFVFNSLNSIKHYALTKSEKETALFINDFSSLIRRIFENSKHKTISIEDEMKMLELYIAIEKRRLGDKFEYEISVDESIDQYDTDIPAMILQPHIENAIWHGLMHKESNGVLKLEIKDLEDSILCRISDNGIGRKRSSQIQNQNRDNFRKSSGTKLTTERIELINKIFDREASISIKDRISEDGKPAGTTIEVILPKIF